MSRTSAPRALKAAIPGLDPSWPLACSPTGTMPRALLRVLKVAWAVLAYALFLSGVIG
jgi:hypothetical protein